MNRALPSFGLDRDACPVTLDDLPADGQPPARSRALVSGVQPVEDDEDAVEVLRRDAEADAALLAITEAGAAGGSV